MVIAIVSPSYPHTHNPAEYAFVKELVDSFARQGHECYVVSPYSILHHRKTITKMYSYLVNENQVYCYRPYYLSFSNRTKMLFELGRFFMNCAANRALKKLPQRPDVIYGHFWHGAYMGYRFAVKYHIPIFVATGESVIDFERNRHTSAFCDYVSGVVCVSSKNAQESVERRLTKPEKCITIPNGVNIELFHPLDKYECRKCLGFPQSAFIVAFVGNFGERKGVLRVSKAIDKIEGVNSIFIGKGPLEPTCKGILYKGPIKHELLPLYLSAADVFVLPTLHEGCCNAIVEAMACGLPIVSSDCLFNHDILNSSNSILVEPTDIESIANAIRFIKDNPDKKQSLSEYAKKCATDLDIGIRSRKIIDYIQSGLNL